MSHIINNHKTQGEWKIQSTMAINFISSEDSEETRTMHSKSDNIEIMIYYYYLLYYKFHKISLIQGGSYIDSPKWLKNKGATINAKNNDSKCFQPRKY